MVDFIIANNFEEAKNNDKFFAFDEDIHLHLQNNEESYPFDITLLTSLSLDGYIHVYDEANVNELIELCENMIQYTWSKSNEVKINTFFIKFLKFCEEAEKDNKCIVAIGD